MDKAIRIAVTGAATIPLDQLEPFQGDLKRLDRDEYERLRKNLIDNGFSFTIHVWQHEGKNYIIDGHQRLTALKMMRENEEWQVPDLPVSIVQADDFASAKRKVLAGVSQYGKYTEQSLFNFMKENEIPFDNVVASFSFPEVDMGKLTSMFEVQEDDKLVITDTPPAGEPNMKSGSDAVKQTQLFFNAEDHAEFLDLVQRLTAVYQKENISDTVLEALREAVKSYNSAQH